MSRVLRCLVPTAVFLLSGCFSFPTLYTDTPLGEPATFKSSEWDGLWICEDGSLTRLRSSVPSMKGLETNENWRECDAEAAAGCWEIIETNGAARRYGDWYLFTLLCKESSEPGKLCHTIGALRRSGESILVYQPDEVRIRQLVNQGKVSGRVEQYPSNGGQRDRVVVGPLTADHYAVLLDPETGGFKLRPGACIRLPGELDPCNKSK